MKYISGQRELLGQMLQCREVQICLAYLKTRKAWWQEHIMQVRKGEEEGETEKGR